jgi:amino acid transporter
MVLELNGMMPKNGGYYQWVKTGLGRKWGFFEGWWSWLFMSVDLAIYPVLFIQYSSFFIPEVADHRYIICLVIIWLGAGLNLLGILPVGRASVIFGIPQRRLLEHRESDLAADP